MRQALTSRQAEVFRFIEQFIVTQRHSPSLEDIRAAFLWVSRASASVHTMPLRRKGWITWTESKARTIRITDAKEGSE